MTRRWMVAWLALPLVSLLALTFCTPSVEAHETLRVRVYGPTCTDRAWKVEVLNHLTHRVRVEMLVIKGRSDAMYVYPGGFNGLRVPTSKIRSKVLVARPSIRNYRLTGYGLLARGYANLSGCAWA